MVNLPDIFGQLLKDEESSELLTEDKINSYIECTRNSKSLLPEFISIVGVDAFIQLVKFFGGTSFKIPTTSAIIKQTGDK